MKNNGSVCDVSERNSSRYPKVGGTNPSRYFLLFNLLIRNKNTTIVSNAEIFAKKITFTNLVITYE